MSDLDKKRLDNDFKRFSRINFERPKKCRNIGQLRFYVRELSITIQDFKARFNYVPDSAYQLLTQYNYLQNRMVFENFKNTY